jgi:hypothetical protein
VNLKKKSQYSTQLLNLSCKTTKIEIFKKGKILRRVCLRTSTANQMVIVGLRITIAFTSLVGPLSKKESIFIAPF